MVRLVSAVAAALDPSAAAEGLAARIEASLTGSERPAGGFLFATAAAGGAGLAIGQRLAKRWPGAELLGTSFAGIIGEGRAWLGEPAVALLAWTEGAGAPTPISVAGGDGHTAEDAAAELVETLAGSSAGGNGVALLFPDSEASGLLEAISASDRTGSSPLIGAVATGVEGGRAGSWSLAMAAGGGSASTSDEATLVGLWIPGAEGSRASTVAPTVRLVGATRSASPWLEITAARPHWIDALEGETPATWIRRQLGLADTDPLEPLLDSLLVRIARSEDRAAPRSGGRVREECEPVRYQERYITGLDPRRGAIGLLGRFARFDRLAFALPDPAHARDTLRAAVAALPRTPLLFQVGCLSRGASLHGDPDLESALVASEVAGTGQQTLGVIGPNQLVGDDADGVRLLVHATILAALGEPGAA